jgi:hypothetical protein
MDIRTTLTEVALVVLFLLITLAVAVPNTYEGCKSSEEAAAATALKSGILPAEVQFQAGDYAPDPANPAFGDYATATRLGPGRAFPLLSGATTTAAGVTLNLLAPTYQSVTPTISGYRFNDPVSVASDQARVWAVITQPIDATHGRRWFAINQAGNIYASHPTVNAWAANTRPSDRDLFGPALTGAPPATAAVPYRR